MPGDLREVWERATPWPAYLRQEMDHYQLWRSVYDHAAVPEWARHEFRSAPMRKLLILAADWCGDAANTVPVLARLAEAVEEMDLRVLERDRFPEVMDNYLTNGTRSIPIAIGLDRWFHELGRWGPRPAPLQAWMRANPHTIPRARRYAYAGRWYTMDKGETALRELLESMTGDHLRTPTHSPSRT